MSVSACFIFLGCFLGAIWLLGAIASYFDRKREKQKLTARNKEYAPLGPRPVTPQEDALMIKPLQNTTPRYPSSRRSDKTAYKTPPRQSSYRSSSNDDAITTASIISSTFSAPVDYDFSSSSSSSTSDYSSGSDSWSGGGGDSSGGGASGDY